MLKIVYKIHRLANKSQETLHNACSYLSSFFYRFRTMVSWTEWRSAWTRPAQNQLHFSSKPRYQECCLGEACSPHEMIGRTKHSDSCDKVEDLQEFIK